MRLIEDTKKTACYCIYNFHRKSNLEKLTSLLQNQDQTEYPVVLLCGPDGSGRDFFLHSVAYQQSLKDNPAVVLSLDYDGFIQEGSTLSKFIDHQIENNPEFNDSKTRQLLDRIKSEIHVKVGSDLIPFFTFGVNIGLSLNDLKEIVHSYAPQPQRSERELILRLLDRITSKGKLILHLKNTLVNCSDAVGLLIQESFRRKAVIAVSCESEEEFQQFFPGESYEAIHFYPYNGSELHEQIDEKYYPNTFDLPFYDLLYRYTQGVPELLAAKIEDIEKQGLFRTDHLNRYFLAEEAVYSNKVMDLFPDIFEPYEKIHDDRKHLLDELLKLACLCGRYFPLQEIIHFMKLDEQISDALQEIIDNILVKCKPVLLLTDYGYGHACFYKIGTDVNIYRFYPLFRNYMLCRMTETEKAQKARKLLNFLEAQLPIRTRAMARIFIILSDFTQSDRKIKQYQNYLIFWVRRENAHQLKNRIIRKLKDKELDPDILWSIIQQTKDSWFPHVCLALLEAYEQNPEGIPYNRQGYILSVKGEIYYRLAEYQKAEPLMQRALKIDEGAFGKDHPDVARDLNNLALLYLATNRLKEAEPLMQRALKIGEASLGKDHPKVATGINNLALLYQETNRLKEAELLMERALKIDEGAFGKDHPDVARDLNNLAMLYLATNRLKEAEPLMQRALKIGEASLGKDHPKVAIHLNNLALLYQATNRLKEAEPLYKRALKIDEGALGKDHSKVARDLNNLAALYRDTNRLKEAEPLTQRVVEIFEKSLGENHPNVAKALNNLALLYQATNRVKEAEPLIQRALHIDEASLGKDHPDVARDLNNLALLYHATNRLKEAEPLMERVLVIFLEFTRRTGHRHPHLDDAIDNYSGLLMEMGHSRDEVNERLKGLAPEMFESKDKQVKEE